MEEEPFCDADNLTTNAQIFPSVYATIR